MADLTEHSLVELAALIRRGKASPVAVMEAHLARIQELNPSLRALVMVSPQALEQAQKAEAALASNQSLGPLHGVPLTVKDTIDTAGLRTASGSRVLKRYVPQEDAPAVARLRAAGASILGKTNVSELAVAYDAENPVFGRTNNPHDLARTPGGSSGGEAAAISACLAPGGIGSDLAGSLRIPAHFCGIVGLKPTNGAVAGEGQWPHAVGPLSLGATLGPLARRVADVHLLFEVMSLRRRKGSRSFSEPNAFLLNYANRLRGRKFLWYADDSCATVAPIIAEAVETAAKALERAGLAGRQEIPPGVAAGPRLWHGLFSHAVAEQLVQPPAVRVFGRTQCPHGLVQNAERRHAFDRARKEPDAAYPNRAAVSRRTRARRVVDAVTPRRDPGLVVRRTQSAVRPTVCREARS